MKLVIYFAMICIMPVIDARCKRTATPASASDPCGHCVMTSVDSENDGVVEYRLCEGDSPGTCSLTQGRLEVFYDGKWGTICSDGWSAGVNANVACKMFGFLSGFEIPAIPATESVPIHLDDVFCDGTEVSITDCPHDDWGVNDCTHFEDTKLVCSNSAKK